MNMAIFNPGIDKDYRKWLQLHLLDHSLAAQMFNIIGKARGLELGYRTRMNNCPVFPRTGGGGSQDMGFGY